MPWMIEEVIEVDVHGLSSLDLDFQLLVLPQFPGSSIFKFPIYKDSSVTVFQALLGCSSALASGLRRLAVWG